LGILGGKKRENGKGQREKEGKGKGEKGKGKGKELLIMTGCNPHSFRISENRSVEMKPSELVSKFLKIFSKIESF
jgi:hypothetical protein